MSGTEFLENCNAWGGNWSAMIISGIRKCFPEQYNNMSNDKQYELFELMQIAADCGVNWDD